MEIIFNYAFEIALSVFIAILTACLKKYLDNFSKERAKDRMRAKLREDALMALNHDMLYRNGKFYIHSNQITIEELRNLEFLYNSYHALGGNGTGTEIYEKCKELPIVEKRTAMNPYYTGKKEY